MMYVYKACATRIWVCVLSGLFIAPSVTLAEVEDPVLELANRPGFNERYAGTTQVNGQFLSGLSYSAAVTHGALADLRLALLRKRETDPVMVCVRVTTDDGRYWAANMYRAASGFSVPPKVPVPTRYGQQLDTYGSDSLLLLATLADDCNDAASKVYVPAIVGTRQESSALQAYVNVSQSRVVAALEEQDNVVVEQGRCKKPAGGPRVTYSHICEIPVNDAMKGRTLQLVIGVKGLTGTATSQRYLVHVE